MTSAASQADLDAAVSARGLRKAFGRQLVLDGIDLDIRRGEAVALLGANGAGKTTLLRIGATLGGVSADAPALKAALAAVELDRWADERVRPFSAGMKRRLSIARLLIAQPKVLLLDEPFTGLDQHGAKWLEEHLQGFKGAGGAVLMSTHSFGRGFDVADRAAILCGGHIAADVAVAPLGAEGVRRLYEVTVEESA